MTRNVKTARKLRQNQTDAERALWFRLRDRRLGGLKFRRQMPLGRYVADFCCEAAHLIVEIDGGQHAAGSEEDALRTRTLEAMGYLLLRFWNNEVLQNTEGVVDSIVSTVNQQNSGPPHPNPLPNGEREQV
jgi:very-short-patch-repair endonuclease